MKKLISFIVILLIVMAGAYFLFSDYITETLSPDAGADREAVSAMCVDNRGNVYYVLDKDGQNRLVAVDNAGNVFLNQAPEVIGDSTQYLVTDIFVSGNNNIVVAAAAYDRASEKCRELSINVFFEDGAFAVRALNVPCDQNVVSPGARGKRFTSISEDETHIYFGLYDGGRVELYGMQKGTYDIAAKLAEFRYAGPPGKLRPHQRQPGPCGRGVREASPFNPGRAENHLPAPGRGHRPPLGGERRRGVRLRRRRQRRVQSPAGHP